MTRARGAIVLAAALAALLSVTQGQSRAEDFPVLSQKEVVEFHQKIGADVFHSTPKEAHKLLVETVDEWEELVRLANIPKM